MQTFTLNQQINHSTFGKGTITQIEERENFEPILHITFNNLVRKDFHNGDIYTIRFTPSSLNNHLIQE